MNVAQLKNLIADLDDDTEIRIAHQPNWPLQTSVSGGVVVGVNDEEIEDLRETLRDAGPDDLTTEERDDIHAKINDLEDDDSRCIFYIAEGSAPYDESPYLPSNVANELGWGRGR